MCKNAYDVNNGYCFEFAEELCSNFEKVRQFETPFDQDFPLHSFVKINGKYYDAECLEGVDDPINLPIYRKFHLEHPHSLFKTTEIAFE